jgi:hypothetical protein
LCDADLRVERREGDQDLCRGKEEHRRAEPVEERGARPARVHRRHDGDEKSDGGRDERQRLPQGEGCRRPDRSLLRGRTTRPRKAHQQEGEPQCLAPNENLVCVRPDESAAVEHLRGRKDPKPDRHGDAVRRRPPDQLGARENESAGPCEYQESQELDGEVHRHGQNGVGHRAQVSHPGVREAPVV